jgi:xanthine dehydrogenase accessory factor
LGLLESERSSVTARYVHTAARGRNRKTVIARSTTRGPLLDWLNRVTDLLDRGETFCLASVVVSPRAAPPPGRKLIVREDGSTVGSTGLEHLDETLRRRAMSVLGTGKGTFVDTEGGVRVFLDFLTGGPKLLLCGAGHIALPLARYARDAGFAVTVLDDRGDFAHPSRFPGCEVLADDFVPALEAMPLGPLTYAVLITRGHAYDADCLAAILQKETAYVGMIGSRRRVRIVLDQLERRGIPRERLDEVFTPIGLPIGAESPEEIALCIVAELVCVRRAGPARARELRAATEGAS